MSRNYLAKVELSWKQFWVSLLYENLAPVLFSPIDAATASRLSDCGSCAFCGGDSCLGGSITPNRLNR
jgi:hypothetical protein